MAHHWDTIDPDLGIYRAGYDFNNSVINCFAFSIRDGGLMVVSPAMNPTTALFDELDALGEVRAIVSPGAFHHLGMPAWKERYPSVPLHATSSGISHIAKQHKGIDLGLQGIEALGPLLPENIHLAETPGAKHPDLVAFIEGQDGKWTWFTNEILGNSPSLPGNFLVRTVFKLTKSAPGLRVITPALWLIGGKKPSVKAFLTDQLASRPPSRLIPCHGDVLAADDLAARIGAEFDRAL